MLVIFGLNEFTNVCQYGIINYKFTLKNKRKKRCNKEEKMSYPGKKLTFEFPELAVNEIPQIDIPGASEDTNIGEWDPIRK